MASLDHAKVVFSGILPDRRDLLVDTMRWLEAEHFTNDVQRDLWKVLVWFYDMSGGVLTRKYIEEAAGANADVARLTLIGELYDQCAASRVTDAEVRASTQILRELRAEHLTAEALTQGMELLTRGGEVEGREVPPGTRSAWDFLQSEFSRINRLGTFESAPEGDLFAEPREGILDYAQRKKAALDPSGGGIRTGITAVDEGTGGLQPGEFFLVVGYTGSGKSMFCAQTAWHAAVHQRKNVFYATMETTRDTTRRRLYARHSRLERFGVREGLDSADLKRGTLTASGEQVLKAVVQDLDEGRRTGAYGHLYVAQAPPDATWSYIAADARRVASRWPIDLIVVDYLALLKPDQKYRDTHVYEMTDMLMSVKTFATSFNDGKGVAVMSPWSVQQTAFKDAREKRRYTLASLSDTSEAEKSPDVLLWLLPLDDEPGKLTCGFLKNRDGEVPQNFRVTAHYPSTYFGDVREMTAGEAEQYLPGGVNL